MVIFIAVLKRMVRVEISIYRIILVLYMILCRDLMLESRNPLMLLVLELRISNSCQTKT